MKIKRAAAAVIFTFLLMTACSVRQSASTGAQEGIRLPILMYHSILKDPARQGKYVVSPQLLEEDLRWLNAHGFTTVLFSQVIACAKGEGTLPEKPVMLTFDDGFFNNYTYAYELAQTYDAKINISPILSLTQRDSDSGEKNPNYSYLPWDTLREMYESGRVEYGNHSYDLHGQGSRLGIRQNSGESRESYFAAVGADLKRAQALFTEKLGAAPQCMVYPYGAYCENSEALVRELGMEASMTCNEHMNYISDEESLFLLGRFLRPSGIDSETYFTRLFS